MFSPNFLSIPDTKTFNCVCLIPIPAQFIPLILYPVCELVLSYFLSEHELSNKYPLLCVLASAFNMYTSSKLPLLPLLTYLTVVSFLGTQARAPNSPVLIVGTHYDLVKEKFPPSWSEDLQQIIRDKFINVIDADKLGLPRVLDTIEVKE